MKNKKITAFYLLAITAMLFLAACGSNTQPDPSSFDEVTVIDNDKYLIKITGFELDDQYGVTLKTYIENKSTDTPYLFSTPESSINGVQAYASLYNIDVPAGQNTTEDITLSGGLSITLPDSGKIGDYSDIELTFMIYNDDPDYNGTDKYEQETVHIYPYGESKAATFVRKSKSSDTVLVDNDDVSIIITDYDENGEWGYTANMYIINKSNNTLYLSADDVSVNGIMIDPYWGTTVFSGKSEFSYISWSNSDFEDNDITSVDEIKMQISACIYDFDNALGEIYENYIYDETVTLNP